MCGIQLLICLACSAPDAVAMVNLIGTNYTNYYKSIEFNWQQYAGAKVLKIAGQNAYDYVDHIASTYSGNYLDHGIRVNSVLSSYRISGGVWSQRLGDLAGPIFPDLPSLTMQLIKVNSTKVETVTFPYRASYIASGVFTDKASFWEANCAVKDTTNGIDFFGSGKGTEDGSARQPVAEIVLDSTHAKAVGLPTQYQPTAPTVASGDVLKAYILPGNSSSVGVVSALSQYMSSCR